MKKCPKCNAELADEENLPSRATIYPRPIRQDLQVCGRAQGWSISKVFEFSIYVSALCPPVEQISPRSRDLYASISGSRRVALEVPTRQICAEFFIGDGVDRLLTARDLDLRGS